jgi:hypothetical protein
LVRIWRDTPGLGTGPLCEAGWYRVAPEGHRLSAVRIAVRNQPELVRIVAKAPAGVQQNVEVGAESAAALWCLRH